MAAGDCCEQGRQAAVEKGQCFLHRTDNSAPLPIPIKLPAGEGAANSPILDQVVLQDLINFGGGSGKAALHQRLQPADVHQGLDAEIQRVPKLERGKRAPVGLIKVFVLEDLQGEGEDALVAAHDFQGRVPEVGHVALGDGVAARELARHRDQQLAGAHDDVPVAARGLLGQASHQVGGDDFVIYYLHQRKGRSLRQTSRG